MMHIARGQSIQEEEEHSERNLNVSLQPQVQFFVEATDRKPLFSSLFALKLIVPFSPNTDTTIKHSRLLWVVMTLSFLKKHN